MNITLDHISKNQQLFAKINGLIANQYESYSKSLKLGMSQTLSLEPEYLKSLLSNIEKSKPKTTKYQDILQTVHDAIQGDIILQQIEPWRDSMVPSSIMTQAFDKYAEYINDIKLDYINNEYNQLNIPDNNKSNYELFCLIKSHQLDDFLDRFFTKKEGSSCSHDKTIFVQKQILKSLSINTPQPLIEYFENTEHQNLNGKRTYWSTDTFPDTDGLITFIKERFYL